MNEFNLLQNECFSVIFVSVYRTSHGEAGLHILHKDTREALFHALPVLVLVEEVHVGGVQPFDVG
jgi:hypothetical protein